MTTNKINVLVIKPLELELLQAWVQGYISALVDNDVVQEGQDTFYSYSDDWDINIHTCGEPNTIRAVAHPQHKQSDGYLETDMSNWIEIDEYNFKGVRKRKDKA
jgi:hypothetical protein